MPTLRHLTIENFKCLKKATLDLGSLTLLAGTNGSGKSTLIQAFLLLRQSWQQDLLQDGQLALNGDLACIGSGQDALFEEADPEIIRFELGWDDDYRADWRFKYEHFRRVLFPEGSGFPKSGALDSRTPFSRDFCYLSADRVPPSSFFSMSVPAVEGHRHLGARGEFTAHFLTAFRNEHLSCPELRRRPEPDQLLLQVEAWLNVIRPGIRLDVKHHDFMDTVELAFQFRIGRQFGGRFRTTNVGFGLTYVLPVITALLSAPPGGLVVIENPEAHLHPRGQSQIGALCALAASAGIQVIVETHSDHILNGIRIAAREGRLDPDKVAIHFFSAKDDHSEISPEILSPKLDADGRFDQWPSGFFDEWDRALDKLLE